MDLLKAVREEIGKPIAILLDTKGPEIRTGVLKDGKKVMLEAGEMFTLTTEEIEGDAKKVSITYDGLAEDVEPGKRILIDDGLIELEVKTINGILEIRALLKECGAPHIPIIAKIENAEGIKNIDEIIHCADGIMVARGDLGVEIPAEKVPYLQKMLIKKCNDNYKPVITATQMLDSMIRNPRPTRAEVTDVANAVYDGTDAVMLSGETAQGKYPVEALQMMVHIIENTEKHLDYDVLLEKAQEHRKKGISSAIGYSSVATAMNLSAKCIITPSVTGATARVVSKFKPKADIIGVTPYEETLRKMQIYWGVTPVKSIEYNTTEDICNDAIDLVTAKRLVEPGDIVVMTAGIPSPTIKKSRDGVSNMMRIAVVE